MEMRQAWKRGVAVATVLLAVAQPAVYAAQPEGHVDWPRVAPALKPDADLEKRVADLLARMSVEEKVGQVIQAEIQYVTPEDVRTYHLGSVLNGGGSLPNKNKHATPAEWLKLADAYYEASMTPADGGVAIPIIWGSDAVHGHNNVVGATIFPHNIGLGAAHDPALMRHIGEVTALEMRATGIDWTFAPTVAVARDDRWGRAYESYSESPDLVKKYARAMVLGLQGAPGKPDFLDTDHVVATAKHFLADGGTFEGDDQGDARLSEKALRDIHGAGYFSAIGAGVQTVMASFSSWNGEKVHGDKYLLTDVLKHDMGFDGFVVGDWNAHGQVPGCTNADCPAAINAGLDLFMVPSDWKQLYKNTLAEAQSGAIPMARLDDAVARILRVKLRAGLFEKGKPSSRGVAGRDDIIGRPEHRAVARQAVRESLVLLKNRGHLLPLDPRTHILVAGDGADNIGKQAGGWTISWQGTGNVNADFPGGQSIFAGLRDAMKAAGGSADLSVDGSYRVKPDAAVVVFGENPYAEGQGDIDTMEFEPGTKQSLKLLKKLKAAGIPVVSVFLSGRPMWVNPEINASDAFVAAWLPGSEGEGVADVLVAGPDGKPRHDFTGRLSFSWPKTPLQEPLNAGMKGYDPLFALGYGLSYASGEAGPKKLPEQVPGVHKAGLHSISLYKGRPMAPWLVMLDDGQNLQQLSGAYAALTSGAATAEMTDKDIQGDAIRITWTPGRAAALTLNSGPALDWTPYSKAGAVLGFDIRVDAVGRSVVVGVRCGDGCARNVDLKSFLKAGAGAGWQRVEIPLACFGKADLFGHITEPFRLTTEGPATLSVANIDLILKDKPVNACPASAQTS